MKSMTGYGRGAGCADGARIAVEIGAVNRRQGEIALNLPRELEPLEPRIRDEVNRRVSRGRLNIRITMELGDGALGARVRLNLPLAKAYTSAASQLSRHLGLTGAVSVESLLRLPGVVQVGDEGQEADRHWGPLAKALDQALIQLQRMRVREGAHLAADLKARIRLMAGVVAKIHRRAPAVIERYREQLRERVRGAGVDVDVDDERMAREVVLFADRCDISEELTRLQSHFKQVADCLRSAEPVGRTLDFLAQEMNREINTLGSKANDATLSAAVVQLKAELERFREQVQNVE